MGGPQGAVNFSTYNAGKAFEWILTESLWTELADSGVDAVNVFVGATSSANYNSFKATLDPQLCNRTAPTTRSTGRDPAHASEHARRGGHGVLHSLGQGPVAYASPDDEFVSRRCFALPRSEATQVWRALQETSIRRPDRVAR